MKKYIAILAVTVFFIQCKKENNFTIAKGQLGKITKETQVHELKDIFAKDSLAASMGDEQKDKFDYVPFNEYKVYSKDGKHLLTLMPKSENDSTSTIESIQIYDSRYKTAKGLNLNSTFKDVVDNYTIDKLESTFSTAVLFLDKDLNATIAIDKKEMGLNDFSTQKVRLDQIPDNAKIKYLTIWFD